jgi:hypothetical protein
MGALWGCRWGEIDGLRVGKPCTNGAMQAAQIRKYYRAEAAVRELLPGMIEQLGF